MSRKCIGPITGSNILVKVNDLSLLVNALTKSIEQLHWYNISVKYITVKIFKFTQHHITVKIAVSYYNAY